MWGGYVWPWGNDIQAEIWMMSSRWSKYVLGVRVVAVSGKANILCVKSQGKRNWYSLRESKKFRAWVQSLRGAERRLRSRCRGTRGIFSRLIRPSSELGLEAKALPNQISVAALGRKSGRKPGWKSDQRGSCTQWLGRRRWWLGLEWWLGIERSGQV